MTESTNADQRELDPHEETPGQQIVELLRLEDVGAVPRERGRHRGDDAGMIDTG